MQTRGARCAGIVGVVDGDRGLPELVEDTLAAGGIPVAVARNAGFDIVVSDFGILHCLYACFVAEFWVFPDAAGLEKLRHPYA